VAPPAPAPVQVKDTGPLTSKKFMAFLVSEISWKILLGCSLYIMKGHIGDEGVWMWWWMITLTICVTFLEVGTILGIAYVDKFVRTAQILAQGPSGAANLPQPAQPRKSPTHTVEIDDQDDEATPDEDTQP